MGNWTPGPWMVEPINDGQTYQITTTETTGFAVVAETPVDGTGRDAANARLIAAAPDLLEALIRAERKLSAYVGVCSGDKELTNTVLPMARLAIAKATGQPEPCPTCAGTGTVEGQIPNRFDPDYLDDVPLVCECQHNERRQDA